MVKDMEKSLKFYQDIVGLNIDSRFKAGPDTEIVFLGEGETKIELICNKQKQEIDPGNDISWGFEVDSIENLIIMLNQSGYKIQGGPFQPNSGIKFIYVLDPNGMKIQFIENL